MWLSPLLDEMYFKNFWRHSWDVCTLIQNNSEFLVCLSVCQLAYFLTEIIQIQGYLQFWKKYLPDIFWRHSWDVCTLIQNNSEFLICLSVCYRGHPNHLLWLNWAYLVLLAAVGKAQLRFRLSQSPKRTIVHFSNYKKELYSSTFSMRMLLSRLNGKN